MSAMFALLFGPGNGSVPTTQLPVHWDSRNVPACYDACEFAIYSLLLSKWQNEITSEALN
jgi:hypothetical protein